MKIHPYAQTRKSSKKHEKRGNFSNNILKIIEQGFI